MIKPTNGIDKSYSELTSEEKQLLKTQSWGSYNQETKTWSDIVFSGRTIRDFLQKRLQVTLQEQEISYDSDHYVKYTPYAYTIRDGNSEQLIYFEAIKPTIVAYPKYRYLLFTAIPTSVSTWSKINSSSATLKNLSGVSSWYGKTTQYIIVPAVNNKTNVTDYIDFKDSLGGSLVDKFEITIANNLAILHWTGASPLNDSDGGATLTLKNQ